MYGEPAPASRERSRWTVYPGVYGGTSSTLVMRANAWGLSPRVRGNPKHNLSRPEGARSIPACTGEPGRITSSCCSSPVYPRVYGGTTTFSSSAISISGLSPRVRGNPPRMAARKCRMGLSPRVRGNHGGNPQPQRRLRSIPACTGEPRLRSSGAHRPTVYPRVYGGTRFTFTVSARISGLSPRVRGNRYHLHGVVKDVGSIPACTGEPSMGSKVGRWMWVYPRVYGGTCPPWSTPCTVVGLSPRVRGNQRRRA